jgi:hypothetical protein
MAKFHLYSILVLFLNFSNLATAEIAKKAPGAQEWAKEVISDKAKMKLLYRKLAVVDSFLNDDKVSGKPNFRKIFSKDCTNKSIFICASWEDSQFAVSINPEKMVSGVAGVARISGADFVVYPEKSKIFVSTSDLKWSSELKIKFEDYAKTSLTKIMALSLESFGYDGVVLDERDGFVLVGSVDEKLSKEGLQGLIIGDSESQVRIDKFNRSGASLMSLVNSWQGYAVFQEIVMDDKVKNSKIGSKVILETASKKGQ